MLCPSVTCAVHSANRTHHAGHVGFHTRVRVKNPSSPNPSTQPGLCPSAGSAHPPRAFPDRVSPSQPCTRGSRPWHGTDYPFTTVQTRAGPDSNYCHYPAFVPPLSQSPSPLTPHAPACHDAHTAFNYIHIHSHSGRRGRMLTHGDRHLPCVQRPHTHGPHTRSVIHTPCLTHT